MECTVWFGDVMTRCEGRKRHCTISSGTVVTCLRALLDQRRWLAISLDIADFTNEFPRLMRVSWSSALGARINHVYELARSPNSVLDMRSPSHFDLCPCHTRFQSPLLAVVWMVMILAEARLADAEQIVGAQRTGNSLLSSIGVECISLICPSLQLGIRQGNLAVYSKRKWSPAICWTASGGDVVDWYEKMCMCSEQRQFPCERMWIAAQSGDD